MTTFEFYAKRDETKIYRILDSDGYVIGFAEGEEIDGEEFYRVYGETGNFLDVAESPAEAITLAMRYE